MSAQTGSGRRAPCACRSESPGPRVFAEAPAAERTAFQRDRDRILHSTAFRRLAQKTQVFMPGTDDHYRTRLTHSLEVAQIARSLARSLGLDEDLTEALALAHDLGHGPFGHTGEDALRKAVAPWADFDHNVQSLRIVVDIEQRYLDFDGLNLTWDTLEGLAKRNGPCPDPAPLLRHYDDRLDLRLGSFAGAEAQVAALADDIAYNAHDLEDGLRAGLLRRGDLDEVAALRHLRQAVGRGGAPTDEARLPFALARGLVDLFVRDVLAESRRRLQRWAPSDASAVRSLPEPVIALSAPLVEAAAGIKSFLFARLYRHPKLLETRAEAHDLVVGLAGRYLEDPNLMPGAWAAKVAAAGGGMERRARLVCDYLAGMTDRHALAEHRRLFDGSRGLA